MAPAHAPQRCSRCSQTFTQKSSLVRHAKRCLSNAKAPTRRKACRQCIRTKSKCDLQRPRCGRCESRGLGCEFSLDDAIVGPSGPNTSERLPRSRRRRVVESTSPSLSRSVSLLAPSRSDSGSSIPESRDEHHPPERLEPELAIEKLRNQARFGASSRTASTGPAARHIMSFVIRVLQSWPRMMAGPHMSRLPPIIHHLQVADGFPLPLAQCSTLVKTWMSCEDGSRGLVHDLITMEVKRLLQQHQSYTGMDLLAATQSLLILAIILLFGTNSTPGLRPSEGAQIIVEMWDMKHRLADTGMFLKDEADHVLPPWQEWAMVSAKRRTILALHHLEWVWSLSQGYPILTCFELAPLPAPSAGYLWLEKDELSWKHQYNDWLCQWKDGSYKIGELFNIKPAESLDIRSEMWLAEVDEYGFMLMSEINAVSCAD